MSTWNVDTRMKECPDHDGCVRVVTRGENDRGLYRYETHLTKGDPLVCANPSYPFVDERTVKKPLPDPPKESDAAPVYARTVPVTAKAAGAATGTMVVLEVARALIGF